MPEKNGCTAEQVFLADNTKYAIAVLQACKSPADTDALVATHKTCGKTCLDTYAAAVPMVPNCTLHGINLRDRFADGYADVQNKCRLLAEKEANITSAPTTISAAARTSRVVAIAVTTVVVVMRL